jgi:glycosyltransferase involved in cell wall biosynthesis
MYDLSIVIPIRETPVHLLNRCLQSINCSNNNGISIQKIVIDDCSNEFYFNEYRKLIKSKYPDVNIKRNTSWRGIGGARNKGAKVSKSEYIMFVDSDDVLRKNSVKKMMNYVANDRVIFSNHIKQNIKDKKYIISNKSIWIKILERYPSGLDCPLLYSNFIGVPSIIPLNGFNKVGGYPELIYSGEHISLWGKLYFELNIELFHIDEILYEYYPRLDGNRYSNVPKHVDGKCEQFMNVAQLAGINVDKYVWVADGHNGLPGLYAPFLRNTLNLPSWASIETSSCKWTPEGGIIPINQDCTQPIDSVGSRLKS